MYRLLINLTVKPFFSRIRYVGVRNLSETVLSFKNVTFEYNPLKPVLNNATFNIEEGRKVTIMGQNGSGKSTLLKLINGHLKPQQGSINIKKGYAVSTALQVITPEDRKRTVKEFFIHYLHGTTSGIDGRIAAALQKVKLTAQHDRLVGSFSGGQQARLLLASALIVEPDILLLDEPTNNLDVRGIEVLRELIQTTAQTCVVISHDEDFLNSFTDSVLYLDNHFRSVESYAGNYKFVKEEIAKRIARENAENARLHREATQKKEQANLFAQKGGKMGKTAKKLRTQAEEMQGNKVTVRKEDKALKEFRIPFQNKTGAGNEKEGEITYSSQYDPANHSIGNKIMAIRKITLPVHLNGRQIDFSASPLLLQPGSFVHLKGGNGTGKSTFLHSLANRELIEGEINIHPQARIGYYRQDFLHLNFDNTVITALREASDNKHTEHYIRQIGARFFLRGEVMDQMVGTLSEGQKALLSFACLVLQEPAVLLVDEPTNHLNFRHIPSIIEALRGFKGVLVLVSHDEDFVKEFKFEQVIDMNDAY